VKAVVTSVVLTFLYAFYQQITLIVIVRVENINDNYPSFGQSEYTLNVNEVRACYLTFVLVRWSLNNICTLLDLTRFFTVKYWQHCCQ